jgi:5-methylcytosine-specific restriction endonuclease McrA
MPAGSEKVSLPLATLRHNHEREARENPPTIDHVVPLALGGTNELSNLALAHGPCNSGKGARSTHLI